MKDTIPELRAMLERATPGPWRSMRDGNQYVQNGDILRVVGASRVEGIRRPWNPHRPAQAKEHETARFLDADADIIAAMRNALPDLLDRLERAESAAMWIPCSERMPSIGSAKPAVSRCRQPEDQSDE